MKKENKKLAQQRKAQEKKRQARKNVLAKVTKIAIPALLFTAVVVLCVTNPFEKDSNGTYSTDSSLTVKDGDTVNIDYVGSVDGVEFDGGSTKGRGADLTIGSGTYIDDFEEQLIGAHPGDTVEVNVTFPENYGDEQLNGKDALFVVEVNGIY